MDSLFILCNHIKLNQCLFSCVVHSSTSSHACTATNERVKTFYASFNFHVCFVQHWAVTQLWWSNHWIFLNNSVICINIVFVTWYCTVMPKERKWLVVCMAKFLHHLCTIIFSIKMWKQEKASKCFLLECFP